ncbi:alpha/beta hydrolase family esterase [Coralliovum pocilloporae]|uniref:alpha/beta hydrolase family esterase n=1 Tax=Coralliovum pocilloporae TaxID=3066369 RepID=UPI0033077B5D
MKRSFCSLYAGFALAFLSVSGFSTSVHARQAEQSCGLDQPCQVKSGDYRLRMPDGVKPGQKVGAILYFHGFNGNAEGVLNFNALKRVTDELGVALIAPDGLYRSWSFPGGPRQRRDELAFIDDVLNDAMKRFAIDRSRIMVSGFSIGGTMAWNLACYRGSQFAGFAPIAGTLWEPLPISCPSPVPNIIHVHGTSDKTFPLTGRWIRGQWKQGDIREMFKRVYKQGQCSAEPPRTIREGRLTCERRSHCGSRIVEFCKHSGGHSVRPVWVARAWRLLSDRLKWN